MHLGQIILEEEKEIGVSTMLNQKVKECYIQRTRVQERDRFVASDHRNYKTQLPYTFHHTLQCVWLWSNALKRPPYHGLMVSHRKVWQSPSVLYIYRAKHDKRHSEGTGCQSQYGTLRWKILQSNPGSLWRECPKSRYSVLALLMEHNQTVRLFTVWSNPNEQCLPPLSMFVHLRKVNQFKTIIQVYRNEKSKTVLVQS